MKEKVDVTRPVPFLKPGNPYRLLDTVCRGPRPIAAARVLIRHLKRAVELLTHNPHPTDFADPLGHRAEALAWGRAPPFPRGEEPELSGDVECLLVLEAQVGG